ncbi:MAG: response regulator, partial [Spirochaetales bacterium]|nr:response regulator [Spirochaetales bacterium]
MTNQDNARMDLDALVSSYESAAGSSPKDSLTGLFNFGFLGYLLDHLLESAVQPSEDITLAIIDIDGFRQLNDQAGYLEGDRLLKTVGNSIAETLRDGDIPARLSNDRFGAVLMSTGAKLAHIAAERIRSAVQNIDYENLSVSIGISSYPEDAATPAELLSHALEAVNHSKMRGKNKVYQYSSTEAAPADMRPHILIVDDDPKITKMLTAQLEVLDASVSTADNGSEALEIVEKIDTDLVLLDVMMPGMDGFEVCKRIKEKPTTRQIPVILITALEDLESRVKGIESGADDFLSKPVNYHEFLARTRSLIKNRQINRNYASLESVLFSLANAVEAKDAYTQGHTERVSNLAVALGSKIGMSDAEIVSLRMGGILHDVGKIATPKAILNKNGPLTDDEWVEMRAHPELGYRICLPLAQSLGMALDVIRHHHEKLDGSSYPDGLEGEEISLSARVLGVVDIYDALTSDRPYREAMPLEAAINILREDASAGKIDETVVEALAAMAGPAKGEQRRTADSEPPKKILAIDDDPLKQKLVQALLGL